MKAIFLIAVLVLAASPAWSQPSAAPTAANAIEGLPDTPMGRAAAAFLRAVNGGGPDAVRAFEEGFRSEAQRGAVSLEERMRRFAEVRAELAPLTVVRSAELDGRLRVTARAGDGRTVVIGFEPAASDPARVDAVSLRTGDGAEPRALSAEQVGESVRTAAEAMAAGYVYPGLGRAMADRLLERLASGGYASVDDTTSLADALTADLREVSGDLHIGVRPAPPAPPEDRERDPAAELRAMAAENFGFREVEILPGNIGYIRFDFFVPGEEAERTAAAAMAFVRNCDALVFDLRGNGGGSPEMIRFLTSYLFESPTHLNNMVDRAGNVVEEYWTVEEVPGERLDPDLPVFVLTSSRTFSGAEEFSYNLKNLGRATIVGERTGGGAHPVRGEDIGNGLMLRVPFMRAQNPISGTNWEGVGVEPDVAVSSPEALERALALAREAMGG